MLFSLSKAIFSDQPWREKGRGGQEEGRGREGGRREAGREGGKERRKDIRWTRRGLEVTSSRVRMISGTA